METANAGMPENKWITLRIGINLGDVMVEGSDLFGHGVDIARGAQPRRNELDQRGSRRRAIKHVLTMISDSRLAPTYLATVRTF